MPSIWHSAKCLYRRLWKILSAATVVLMPHLADAQFWASAGLPGTSVVLQEVYATPNEDTLYYCGTLQLNGVSWWASNSIMRLTAQGWDTLGVVHGVVTTVVHWHDTLVVGGAFTTVNSDTMYNVAAHVNGNWLPFGVFQDLSVRRLRIIDEELYAVGSFDSVDGDTTIVGIAVRRGGAWHRVGNSVEQDDPQLLDLTSYNGSIAAIGLMGNEDGRGIMQLIDSTWQLVGPGIQGGLSGAHSIMEYQGDLYVGGQLRLGEGNAGQDIMRWDGSQFHALGLGLQRELGNTYTFSDCRAMRIHDGLLFVGGGFRYAGGIPSDGVAVWDGSQWCGVPGILTEAGGGAMSIAFYHDTLFVACGWLADGDSVNQAARFIGASYIDSCSGPLSTNSPLPLPEAERVFPNPATSVIRFTPPFSRNEQAVIVDALGRIVVSLSGRVPEFDVTAWPRGMYTVLSTKGPATRFLLQ